MKLFALPILVAAFVRVNSDAGVVDHSTSPDGKFHIESTFASDGTYFAVVAKDGRNVSPPFESDFGVLRSIDLQCKLTKVYWRRDDAFVVLDSGHDRHHQDFFIARKAGNGFELLSFNPEKIYGASKLSAHFLYPEFVGWRSNGDLKMRIVGFNGLDDYRPIEFTLRLTKDIRVVAMELGPEIKN
jgi:hypothetical protein